MSRLRYPLKDGLVDPASEEALARIWRGIDARQSARRPPGSRGNAGWLITSVVMAAAVAVAVWAVPRRDHGPLRFADGRPLAVVDAPAAGAVVSISDGSIVDLAAGARLAPLESSGTSFVAVLERGSAHFEVRPGGPRRWQIECGLATVEVVGTGFDCARAPGRLRVAVEHGAVLVRGERVPDRARRLAAGDTLDVARGTARTAGLADDADNNRCAARPVSGGRPGGGAGARAGAGGSRQCVGLAGAGAGRTSPRGVRLAGDTRDRARDAPARRRRSARCWPTWRGCRVTPSRRWCRWSGSCAGSPAIRRRRWRRWHWAASSWMRLHRPADAAVALNRALALGVPASLREDVRARLVEAYARAENWPAARAAAAAYVREFPDGRYLSLVQSRLR